MASEQVRDWSHDWSAGSFRGVPFWCDKISRDGGRRLVVHQFPLRDTPYVEDLGADAKKLTVTVYVASEGADGEATALEQQLELERQATASALQSTPPASSPPLGLLVVAAVV